MAIKFSDLIKSLGSYNTEIKNRKTQLLRGLISQGGLADLVIKRADEGQIVNLFMEWEKKSDRKYEGFVLSITNRLIKKYFWKRDGLLCMSGSINHRSSTREIDYPEVYLLNLDLYVKQSEGEPSWEHHNIGKLKLLEKDSNGILAEFYRGISREYERLQRKVSRKSE